MISTRTLHQIQDTIHQSLKRPVRLFLFGSVLKRKNFRDVDVGILNAKISETELSKVRTALEESNIPYTVDLVDFSQVEKSFKEEVFNQDVKWLT